jgi:hypothetical protein
VEKARRAFRRQRRDFTKLSRQEYLEAHRARGAAISKAKRPYSEEPIEQGCK